MGWVVGFGGDGYSACKEAAFFEDLCGVVAR